MCKNKLVMTVHKCDDTERRNLLLKKVLYVNVESEMMVDILLEKENLHENARKCGKIV